MDLKRPYGAGSIIRRPGSDKLYVKIRIYGYVVCRTSGFKDTAEGRKKAHAMLDQILRDIRNQNYDHSSYFPNAPPWECGWLALLVRHRGSVKPTGVLKALVAGRKKPRRR